MLPLGDAVKRALEAVGVDERTLGLPACGCDERRRKLNALDAWARRVLSGKLEAAEDLLRRVLT